jgi:ABC-type multidrug transport system fused ATPase/permease subunit
VSDQGQGPAVGVATKGPGGSGTPLLEIRDLSVSFPLERSTIHALQGLSLHVRAGERLGVVGESGSGKSVTAQSVMRMVPSPGRVTSGQILFEGHDILGSRISWRSCPSIWGSARPRGGSGPSKPSGRSAYRTP